MPFSRPLVLASASARRARILAEIDVPFVVAPVDAPEPRTEDPVESAVAAALSKHAAARALHPGEFLCTADTLVECGGAVLGKPADRADAVAMLLRLSGRTHRVFTAVALSAPGAAGLLTRSISITGVCAFCFCSMEVPLLIPVAHCLRGNKQAGRSHLTRLPFRMRCCAPPHPVFFFSVSADSKQ